MGITATKSRTLTLIKPSDLHNIRVCCKFLFQLLKEKASSIKNAEGFMAKEKEDHIVLLNHVIHNTYQTIKTYSSNPYQSTEVVSKLEDLQHNIVRIKFEENQLLIKYGPLFYDQVCELYEILTNIKVDILEEQLDYCGEEGLPFVKRVLYLSKGLSINDLEPLPYNIEGEDSRYKNSISKMKQEIR